MEADKKAGVVYGLYEPGSLLPFYIGCTNQKRYQRRLTEHLYDARHDRQKSVAKELLIREILNAGNMPEIKVLESVLGDLNELKAREVFWIAELKPKTNYTSGGDWNPMLSEKREQAIANSKATKAKKRTDAAVALGITEEELFKRRAISYREKAHEWASCQPEVCRRYSKEHRAKRRREMGEAAWKKLVADEKRNWYANMAPEQKEEFKRHESEYRKRRRDERKKLQEPTD